MAQPTVAEPTAAQRTLVHYEVKDGVAYLTLDDPPANTYTHEMMRQLDEAILQARFDKDVLRHRAARRGRQVLLRRRQHQHAQDRPIPYFKYYFCLHANETLNRLEQTPKLVIAALERPHRRRRPRDRHGGGPPHRARRAPARSACPRSPSACSPAPAARSAWRAWSASATAIELMVTGRLSTSRRRSSSASSTTSIDGDDFVGPGPRVRRAVLPAEQGRQGGRPHQALGAVRRRGAVRERPRDRARAAAAALPERGRQGRPRRLRQKRKPEFKGLVSGGHGRGGGAGRGDVPAGRAVHRWRVGGAGGREAPSPTENPATEETLCEVAAAGAADVDRAVAAARAALDGDWGRKTPARERGRLLWQLADAPGARIDEFAAPGDARQRQADLRVARTSTCRWPIERYRYYAGWADKITGETIPVDGAVLHLHAARAGRRRRRRSSRGTSRC